MTPSPRRYLRSKRGASAVHYRGALSPHTPKQCTARTAAVTNSGAVLSPEGEGESTAPAP